MDPIAQQFIDALATAEAAKDKTIGDARTVRDAALFEKGLTGYGRTLSEVQADEYNTIDTEYYRVTDAAQAKYSMAYGAAWDLLATSTEPQVAFIGTTVRSYVNEVKLVLPILPASIMELRALARENDWCNEFRDYLWAAVDAGVVESGTGSARGELEEYLEGQVNNYARDVILRLVDRVVAEAVPQDATSEA